VSSTGLERLPIREFHEDELFPVPLALDADGLLISGQESAAVLVKDRQ
jgi:hypothetical protein